VITGGVRASLDDQFRKLSSLIVEPTHSPLGKVKLEESIKVGTGVYDGHIQNSIENSVEGVLSPAEFLRDSKPIYKQR
jgi:hypothetical protein